MKTRYFMMCALLIITLSSFSVMANEACDYVGSNMEYVKTQTRKAIATTDLNESHFLAYRAIKALQNSQKKIENCDCMEAADFAAESLNYLISATKAKSLNTSRAFLNRSLENTIESIESIENHDNHGGPYGTDVLALNTIDAEKIDKPIKIIEGQSLKEKIDISLISYEASLQTVVETVNCKEALAFATRIYDHCEQQLLKNNLSEGKKYYNLRTKQITAEALKKIGDCSKK